MAFGYGYRTWEWQRALRGFFHPGIFALLFKALQMFGLDQPEAIATAPRILQGFSFSFYFTFCTDSKFLPSFSIPFKRGVISPFSFIQHLLPHWRVFMFVHVCSCSCVFVCACVFMCACCCLFYAVYLPSPPPPPPPLSFSSSPSSPFFSSPPPFYFFSFLPLLFLVVVVFLSIVVSLFQEWWLLLLISAFGGWLGSGSVQELQG